MEIESRVPYFNTVADVREAQVRKASYLPADLYPRDGNFSLARLEEKISQLIGIEAENLLLYSSGMSAIVDVLEINHPGPGTVIAYGEQLYYQSSAYIKDVLIPRGVRAVQVNSGSIESITRVVTKFRPQLIFLETVANSPDMPVLDIDRLVNSGFAEQRPLVVLDNTLPSPTALPLAEMLKSHPNTVVVESGTKFYSLNKELCGIIYTYNQDLLNKLRTRRRFGSILSPSAVETINRVLLSPEAFHARNRRILLNALTLAQACSLADSGDFTTVHPNLPDHLNQEYANLKYPFGASPLFFIQATNLKHLDQFQLTEKLWENPLVRCYCRLGQSFGFNQTRLWPDSSYPSLRVAGGTESKEEINVLAAAFRANLVIA